MKMNNFTQFQNGYCAGKGNRARDTREGTKGLLMRSTILNTHRMCLCFITRYFFIAAYKLFPRYENNKFHTISKCIFCRKREPSPRRDRRYKRAADEEEYNTEYTPYVFVFHHPILFHSGMQTLPTRINFSYRHANSSNTV